MKEKDWLILLVMILILALVPFNERGDMNSLLVTSEMDDISNIEFIYSYTEHNIIEINSDVDFENQAASNGWIGNGSESNPYLIQNLNITNSSMCISISDVSVHFIISDCFINCTSILNNAIDLETAPNGIIENSIIKGGAIGVRILYSPSVRVENCTISGANTRAIGATYSNWTEFIDLEIYDCFLNAISVYDSDHSLIQNCTVYNITDSYALFSTWSDYLEIMNCTVFDSADNGIELQRSDDVLIMGNKVHHIGQTNSGVGVDLYWSNRCVIVNNDVYDNDYCGIRVYQSEDANITQNRIFNNVDIGVFAHVSEGGIIENNEIYEQQNPADAGIYSYKSADWIIRDNWLSRNRGDGIYLRESNGTLVEENEIHNSGSRPHPGPIP